jgi:sulfotransferase
MSKKYYFITGMPRSGSTLLCNILNQNPRFKASETSPTVGLLSVVSNFWANSPECKASKNDSDLVNAQRAILDSLYSSVDAPVIFDKSRGWVSAHELLEKVLGERPKMLVTTRDIPSILSSCEKIFRKELKAKGPTAPVSLSMETIEGRLAHWTSAEQLVGGCYNRLRDCIARVGKDDMHFIDFDNLTSNPELVMRVVYKFLGEEYYDHDFNNIEQTTSEDDSAHGFIDLHTIRPKVAPVKKDYKSLFGDAIKPYMNYNYDFI